MCGKPVILRVMGTVKFSECLGLDHRTVITLLLVHDRVSVPSGLALHIVH